MKKVLFCVMLLLGASAEASDKERTAACMSGIEQYLSLAQDAIRAGDTTLDEVVENIRIQTEKYYHYNSGPMVALLVATMHHEDTEKLFAAELKNCVTFVPKID